MGNFDFLAKICPNMDLGLETEKTSVGIGISILEMWQFLVKWETFTFLPKFAQKWI